MSKYGTYSTNTVANPSATPGVKPAYPYPGRQLSIYDTYTAAALTNDNVILAHVNKGDVIIGGQLWWAALGSGVLLTVGDTLDCDRFMTTVTATSSSAALGASCSLFGAITGVGFQYTADCDIFVNVSGAAATGAIHLRVDLLRTGQ